MRRGTEKPLTEAEQRNLKQTTGNKQKDPNADPVKALQSKV